MLQQTPHKNIFFSKYAPLNLFQFVKKTLMENFTADLISFTEESWMENLIFCAMIYILRIFLMTLSWKIFPLTEMDRETIINVKADIKKTKNQENWSQLIVPNNVCSTILSIKTIFVWYKFISALRWRGAKLYPHSS